MTLTDLARYLSQAARVLDVTATYLTDLDKELDS